jgi:hypothetical protein
MHSRSLRNHAKLRKTQRGVQLEDAVRC